MLLPLNTINSKTSLGTLLIVLRERQIFPDTPFPCYKFNKQAITDISNQLTSTTKRLYIHKIIWGRVKSNSKFAFNSTLTLIIHQNLLSLFIISVDKFC